MAKPMAPNGPYLFDTAKPEVACVDSAGSLSGVATGETIITATAG
jgi:hypothetical protein